ncbi:MAG: PepSY domain-containing protein [Saprospiraceae bacterium]|nr:PepSY domain-containing protein [Saprospiraceae bacterium]
MKQQRIISSLRQFRMWHRVLGVFLALFVVISAITGVFLAFKKNVAILQPPTQKTTANNLREWKSLAEIEAIAQSAFQQTFPDKENKVERLDVQPAKGIVKVLFKNGWWEVQLDGSTGEVLSIGQRHADWIEKLHDGSIIGDTFKLIAMNFLGLGAFHNGRYRNVALVWT